jgi:spore coat protein CotF
MDFQNLLEHHQELLSYMESNGYSEVYISRFRDKVNWILQNAETKQWESYKDIYLDYT